MASQTIPHNIIFPMEYNICIDKLPTATTAHLLRTKWFANCTWLSQGKSECEHGYIVKNEVGYSY